MLIGASVLSVPGHGSHRTHLSLLLPIISSSHSNLTSSRLLAAHPARLPSNAGLHFPYPTASPRNRSSPAHGCGAFVSCSQSVSFWDVFEPGRACPLVATTCRAPLLVPTPAGTRPASPGRRFPSLASGLHSFNPPTSHFSSSHVAAGDSTTSISHAICHIHRRSVCDLCSPRLAACAVPQPHTYTT